MEEESVNYLEQILSNVEPEDAWEKMHKQIVLNKYCRFFINLYKTNDKGSYINNETSKVCYLFSGKLELIDSILNDDKPDLTLLKLLLDEAFDKIDQALLKEDKARLFYYSGLYYELKRDHEMAKNYFNMSVNVWNVSDNPAKKILTGN